jgi:hypothetical protein
LTYRKIDRIAFRKLFFLPKAKKRKEERYSIKAQTGKKQKL